MADSVNPTWSQDINTLLANAPDNASLRAALTQLQKDYKRQTRQLNRLVKLADASADRLNQSNATLDRLSMNLARFVPQPVVDGLRAGKVTAMQSVRRTELTLFFSDIVGFTQMSERLEPEQLAEVMGSYFAAMTEVCDKWGGTLDQFIGDAIVIFFGDPNTHGADQDAVNAVHMAQEMQQRLVMLRDEWATQSADLALHVRMGLSTGFCSVGNFGSSSRLHYTALGNVVNEAARIQSQCPVDSIMISEGTYRRIRDQIKCQKAARVILEGRRHPVQIYEPVYAEPSAPEQSVIAGKDDGFRLYLDQRLVTNPDRVYALLYSAIQKLPAPPRQSYENERE